MNRDEQEYLKMQEQMQLLRERMQAKKEILDKERDEQVIRAIREVNLSREQGEKLSKLIKDKRSFEMIMKMEPMEQPVTKRRIKLNKINESEVKADEE